MTVICRVEESGWISILSHSRLIKGEEPMGIFDTLCHDNAVEALKSKRTKPKLSV